MWGMWGSGAVGWEGKASASAQILKKGCDIRDVISSKDELPSKDPQRLMQAPHPPHPKPMGALEMCESCLRITEEQKSQESDFLILLGIGRILESLEGSSPAMRYRCWLSGVRAHQGSGNGV